MPLDRTFIKAQLKNALLNLLRQHWQLSRPAVLRILLVTMILSHSPMVISQANLAANSPISSSSLKSIPPGRFLISASASASDWGHFKQQPFESKKELWNYHQALGKTLKNWHWQWRVGWIQSCGASVKVLTDRHGPCPRILSQGARDKALVVRSEVVRVYAHVFAGSGHKKVIHSLEDMFSDPRNYRHKKPLFIAKDIIYAMEKIGGSYGRNTARRLARPYPKLRKYHRSVIQLSLREKSSAASSDPSLYTESSVSQPNSRR